MNGVKSQTATPGRNIQNMKQNQNTPKQQNQLGPKQNNTPAGNKVNQGGDQQQQQQQSFKQAGPQQQQQNKIPNGSAVMNKSNGPGPNRINQGQQQNVGGGGAGVNQQPFNKNKNKGKPNNNNMGNNNSQTGPNNQQSGNNPAAINVNAAAASKSPKQINAVHRSTENVSQKYDDNMAGVSSRPHYPGQIKVVLGQPTLELPTMDHEEKKFTGRCRIFVANLPNNTTEEQVRKLFEEFGQVSEVYLAKSNFGFVKMDTRRNAEMARNSLDGRTYEGRQLRVRLAAHAAAIRVKNLSPFVTNELLEYAFSYFGEVERAIVITDDRGRSIGEGIVEFARKFSATNALKRCSSDCFLLTGSPKPVFVESFEQRDEEEGFPEKQLNKNSADFRQERELGPRFAEPGSFEHEYGMRWKQLYELEKQKRESLEQEIHDARKLLQEQQQYSRMEHDTNMLRDQLREMEEKADQFAQLRNTRMDEERRREEERRNNIMCMRQQEEQIIRRQQMQDYNYNDLKNKHSVLQELVDKVSLKLDSLLLVD